MSKNLNRCDFIGNFGKDPEQRFTPSGVSVVSFSLAVGDDYKSKDGNKVEQTEWVNFTAFGKTGEIIAKYCQKGSKIWVSGKLKTDKYEKDGQAVYSTKIHVQEFEFLGGNQNSTQTPNARGSASTAQGGERYSPPGGQPNFEDFDDQELPF